MPGTNVLRGHSFGHIYNLRVWAYSSDAVLFTWEYDNAYTNQIDTIYISTFVNGTFYAKTRANYQIVGGLDTGKHEIDIMPLPVHLSEYGDWLGRRNQGSRLYLNWVAGVDENDTASYQIYSNSGSGDLSYTSELATVDTIEATHLTDERGKTGRVTETLSSSGTYYGQDNYVQYYMYSTSSTKWKWLYRNDPDGGWTFGAENIDITTYPQEIVYSDGTRTGIYIQFTGSDYTPGTNWTLTIGCRSYYNTTSLDNGNWKFVVRASDSVGNESANETPVLTATVAAPPPMLEDLAITYDNDTYKATITWTAVDASITANVYSNTDHLTELVPQFFRTLDTTTGDTGTWTSGVLTAGVWVFVVRASNSAGEEENLYLLKISLAGSPAQQVTNATAPLYVSAQAEEAGAATCYATVDDTVVKVRVYSDLTTGTLDYSNLVETYTVPTNLAGQVVKALTIPLTFADLSSTEGAHILGFRSESSSEDVETNTDKTATVTIDNTAPEAPASGTVTRLW